MSEAPPKRTFTTWKEIAQFFARDIRTVQRWEKEEGLPVHRHLHQRQSSVYAHEEELEVWRRERGALMEESAPVAVAAKRRGWIGWIAAAGTLVVAATLGWWGLQHRTEANPEPAFAVITLEGTRPGGALYGADTGDLNGDGVADFVLSAWEAREVYLYFGGKLPAPGREIPLGASVIVTGAERGSLGVTEIGDFNGDGLADLLLSVGLDEPESFREGGRSYVLWGRREWPKTLALPRDADVTFWYDAQGDPRMGGCTSLSGPQDLNDDGIDDVLLSLADHGPERPSAGAVFVFWGRRTWPKQVEVHSQADFSILGSRSGEGLGNLCLLGDFNSDGKRDLGVVAGESRLWGALGGRARFYLFFGRERWPRHLDAKSDFDLRVDGVRKEAFGMVPVFADLNGDGHQDLILGWAFPMGKENFPGELQIWFGGKDRRGVFPADAADVRIFGNQPGSALSAGLAVTDLDSDGLQDLVVSAFGTGELYLLYGRREWRKTGKLDEYAPVTLLHGDESLGYQRIGITDLDGDLLPELVTTSSLSDTARGPKSGRAWILKPYLPLSIDVRPDKEPNVLLQAGGVMVVRVDTAGLSPDDPIDPASLRLGGAPQTFHIWDDFNHDGRPELQVHFESPAVKVPPEATRVALTGRMRSGRPIAGTDSIVLVPPANKVANGKR